MYAVHLRGWLQLFPPRQVGVVDPALLLAPESLTANSEGSDGGGGPMRRLLGFPGLSIETQAPQRELRENTRRPVISPEDLPKNAVQRLAAWLRPHNCRLGGLLARHGLGGSSFADVPWLVSELRDAQQEGGQAAMRCRTLTALESSGEGG